jgi:hypothetical protein
MRADTALQAAVPLSFLASALGCTGLEWQGCTVFCTAVKLGWPPLLAILMWRRAWFWTVALAAVAVLPHCVCRNPVNNWWIDHLGASPLCYAWGLAVTVIAVRTLAGRRNPLLPLLACYGVIAGATAFFIGHFYFRFPW